MNPRTTLIAASLLLLGLLSAGCQPTDPVAKDPVADAAAAGPTAEEDIAAIRALQDTWNQAVEAGSVEGYLGVLDVNIELLPTDAPPINGTTGYRGMLEGVFSSDTFDIEVVDRGTITVDGDIGYARYDYIIHRTPIVAAGEESETVSSYRKFLDIMRRQEDGSWRVYKHIWNYNEPGVVP
jgi:ketosteroid isomerase-like protein